MKIQNNFHDDRIGSIQIDISPVFSNKVFVVFGRFMITINSLSTNGIYGRVPSPVRIN